VTTEALARIVRRPARAPEVDVPRCDLCGLVVPDQHRHVVDLQRDELMCTCRACTLLFDREAAGRGHYRLVPGTRTRLADVPADDLGVPVGLVFLVPHGDGTVTAHYPSPMGATQHEIEPAVWAGLQRRCPELADMAPDVQALLLHTARGADERWLVPIDDCYRLVTLIRREWRGLSGGSQVWPAIEGFFADLAAPRRHTY
jgi:hypothetical protein